MSKASSGPGESPAPAPPSPPGKGGSRCDAVTGRARCEEVQPPAGGSASLPVDCQPGHGDRGVPLFEKVFCGLGRLSKAAKDLGFHTVSIDKVCKAQGVKVLQLDLSRKEGRSLLKDVLDRPGVVWVHWAPPCGTFSRAREIRHPGGPRPLRDRNFVRGLPSLKDFRDRARVRAANSLVELMSSWCRHVSEKGVCWSIENPTNSLIWLFPGLSGLVAKSHVVTLHACMFGSTRRKSTTLVSNRSWFRRTAVLCSGDHAHESWGHRSRMKGSVFGRPLLRVLTRPSLPKRGRPAQGRL